jgi:hypothetical protein
MLYSNGRECAELLVRTTKLLLAVEASQLQEGQSGAGNSIILSSSA